VPSENPAPIQLRERGFADSVAHILREAGLEPKRFELEITESSVMQERRVIPATLASLRKLGVRISVDDFGTGYSSMAVLKKLPVDAMKIDQSFIRGITSDPAEAMLTTALITTARGLGLSTVAEGVESPGEMQFT
jgi:EAL domain-containing protein (putative c-di-GMP-specific phosphodiesterase class I)